MKLVVVYLAILVASLGIFTFANRNVSAKLCWCWPPVKHAAPGARPQNLRSEYAAAGAYGTEADWNNPEHLIELNYRQDQGKRVFYQQCVWCHADTTPAGPSNRSNVSPDPPLMNDGAALNGKSDADLRKIVALGGSAVGKSAMMPPYGSTLTLEEIDELIAYMRAIAVPEYKASSNTPSTQGNKPL